MQLPAHILGSPSRRTQRLLNVLAVVALLAGMLPSSLLGQGIVRASTVDDLNQQINQLSQQESNLTSQIESLNKQIAAKQGDITSLSNQVALLQQEVDQLQLQIEDTQAKIDRTNAQIQKTTIEIRATEQRIAGAKEQLGALIRLLAQLDDANPFEVIVANHNFSDLLDQVQYTERIQGQTQQRLDEIQQLKAQLDTQKQNLDIDLRQSQQLKAQLTGQQAGVDAKKAEKADLLDKTKGEQASYQKLLSSNEAQRKKVQDQLNAAEKELAASTGFSGTPPPLGSGIFIKPVNGELTQGFGMTDYAKGGAYGGKGHTGMDFSGPLGSPVFAAADGVVKAKGALGVAAYGNWLAIYHPAYNVTTLYGHLITLPSIAVGATVKQGDVVANEGSTGYSSGPHVHFGVGLDFTVYNGSMPVANWINPAPYLAL